MRRAGQLVLGTMAGALGVGLALVVGIAVAKTFTLDVAKNATVTNFNTQKSKQENIIVDGGFAVYSLSGDSKKHPKCTKVLGCFKKWPPVMTSTGKKPTKVAGISGKLGTWKRNGFTQVTLGGHPLYFFFMDVVKRHAKGEDIHSFGGTWHVMAVGGAGGKTTTTGTTPTGTTTTGTTPTNPYPLPPH